ncbi:unnamed protein product, partial [Didymodactylos carnosus]
SCGLDVSNDDHSSDHTLSLNIDECSVHGIHRRRGFGGGAARRPVLPHDHNLSDEDERDEQRSLCGGALSQIEGKTDPDAQSEVDRRELMESNTLENLDDYNDIREWGENRMSYRKKFIIMAGFILLCICCLIDLKMFFSKKVKII